jgi:hypothetical protein
MKNSFSDMDSVFVYVDDTLIADKSVEKHLLHLDQFVRLHYQLCSSFLLRLGLPP